MCAVASGKETCFTDALSQSLTTAADTAYTVDTASCHRLYRMNVTSASMCHCKVASATIQWGMQYLVSYERLLCHN